MRQGIAYLDGRDLQADPPLTIRRIRVWDGVPRRRVVGRAPHGRRVRVLFERAHEGQAYALIEWRAVVEGQVWTWIFPRRGWVRADFLSDRREEPVGDWFHG